ncbi:acyl-CoA dehydrogenase [Nocardioides mangrovicus]|uniref:Dibenzothiophene monooxygenase n=1 Tax=Nocardioides mangrovicus TaxID=2478913 RepID=A0A3L8NZI2_9ACTN|nr:acyl-CoA dehydrogenase family protein [Nocardioides mangrovicus]RLV47518.1 acyl-CoA dehydrogenase [Nocardioides mangrovicus]
MTTDTVASTSTPVRAGSPELRALLDRIAVDADVRDRERIAPFEQIGWLKQAGLGRLRVPVAEGGGGASLRELFTTLIELAEADSNVAHILRTHFWFVEQQLQSGDAASRARGLALVNADRLVGNGFSEQSKHAVGLHFDTTLTPEDGGGYRLDGEKFYSTGTLYSDYTQIWAATPDGRIAGAVVPLDRDGVTVEDDWDGFGQRLTATGTTRLDNVRVEEEEYFDLGDPDHQDDPVYQGAFLQLYLQAVTVGILRSVRNDAVALVQRRSRNFSHAAAGSPAEDRQVLQVVGEISADAFAAEAIVLAAADRLQEAADSVVDGLPTAAAAEAAQLAAAQAKVAIDRFSYATAARLFDVGGASATQSVHNLDRHWRNARTASTHNPTFLKASAIGDHEVNGAAFPGNAYF